MYTWHQTSLLRAVTQGAVTEFDLDAPCVVPMPAPVAVSLLDRRQWHLRRLNKCINVFHAPVACYVALLKGWVAEETQLPEHTELQLRT